MTRRGWRWLALITGTALAGAALSVWLRDWWNLAALAVIWSTCCLVVVKGEHDLERADRRRRALDRRTHAALRRMAERN